MTVKSSNMYKEGQLMVYDEYTSSPQFVLVSTWERLKATSAPSLYEKYYPDRDSFIPCLFAYGMIVPVHLTRLKEFIQLPNELPSENNPPAEPFDLIQL